MKKTSIYDKIRNCLRVNGKVPHDFVLEEREYRENKLHFAPGALEGILGHHSVKVGEAESLAEKIKGYIHMAPEIAMERFESEVAKDGQMASARKEMQKTILEHQEEYDGGKLFGLAYFLTENGTKVETVKLGLSLLALFRTGELQEVCNTLRILGCCEEFADYVMAAAADWTESDRQELYFELAKQLHGWGKIAAVERMKADSEEKKEWILCHGCKNSVMNAYLGYECAVKCDFRQRLEQGNLSEEEFLGAREIMEGLLDEGPCEGLSAMEDPVELVWLYLEECEKHFMDVDLIAQLADIRAYFDQGELDVDADETVGVVSGGQVLEKVASLLRNISPEVFLAENIADKTHQCIRIAKEVGIDVSQSLIQLMWADFSKYYQFCYYLFEKESYVEEFLALCEREVKESDYPNEMGDSFGFGRERGAISLDLIVQYLHRYPLCGKKMIRICLRSPITRWRNMAGRSLLGWVEKLGGTLADIDSELFELVEDVAARECNEGTKETWRRLLCR